MTVRRPAVPLAVAGWALLIAVGFVWGTHLNDVGDNLRLNAPPLYGKWHVRLGVSVLWPIGVATAVVAAAPRVTREARWPALLVAVGLGALLFDAALALIDGWGEITAPLKVSTQYIHAVWLVGSPGDFLSHFVGRIDLYPAHVRAHPPAFLLILWVLDQSGLTGPGPAAWLIIVAGVSAGPAALITLRRLAGEAAARRAAPFFVLSAAGLTIATTADAFYMAVGAWGVAALVAGIDGEGRRADGLALTGGLLLGLALFCSYGLLLLGLVPLAVALGRRRVRPLVVALFGTVAVFAAFAAAGFWWPDGFRATRAEYLQSVARHRPYDYFVIANLSAFAVWLGPAVAIGLARLRDGRIWLLVAGALAAVAFADVSGMSKAETERIWLPFLPWIVLATAALPTGRTWTRVLLASQAALAIAVAVTVSTKW